jgi:hypothetical protein
MVAAAQVIDGGLKRVSEMMDGSRKGLRLLAQSVRGAKKDPTGNAHKGLQNHFMEELFNNGLTKNLDINNAEVLSAQKIKDFWGANKLHAIRAGLFTKQEASRLDRIILAAERSQRQGSVSQVTNNKISSGLAGDSFFADFAVRILGANIGSKFASGSGGSFVAAAAGSRLARKMLEFLPKDKVLHVLEDAVRDPDKMRLLLRMDITKGVSKKDAQLLNAWLISLGIEHTEELSNGK